MMGFSRPVSRNGKSSGHIFLAGSLETHHLQHASSLTRALKATTCWKTSPGLEEDRNGGYRLGNGVMAASMSWCEGYGIVEAAQCVLIAPLQSPKSHPLLILFFTSDSNAMSQESLLYRSALLLLCFNSSWCVWVGVQGVHVSCYG